VAFKRAKNILRGMPEEPLDPSLFLPSEEKEGAGERALYEAVEGVRQEAVDHFDCGRYAEGLQRLATVRPAVDRFFDDVLVMCDPEGKDPARTALQNNRLALLRRVVALFDRVADFSQIVPRESC
jgi:glycyl-tRNA synthetase beta chain